MALLLPAFACGDSDAATLTIYSGRRVLRSRSRFAGAVAEAGLLRALPPGILGLVPDGFADRGGAWVGTSGRSRSVVCDSSLVDPADLPADLRALKNPVWRERLGIAPTNGSFVASVAAMILLDGSRLPSRIGACPPVSPGDEVRVREVVAFEAPAGHGH